MPDERTKAANELNAQCIETLKQAGVTDGGFVIVVGAGVSIPLIPSGRGLRAIMAEKCGIADDKEEYFWEFFQRARDSNQEAYRRTIIETFCDIPEWHPEACRQIVQVPGKSIITLNYDDHLQEAFSQKFGMGWEERFAVYPVQDQKRRWVGGYELEHTFHLLAAHGYRVRDTDAAAPDFTATWPDDGIILTTKQFREHYFDHNRSHALFLWWSDIFCRFSCLFIGTSLQEPGIDAVITKLESDRDPNFLSKTRIQLQDVSPLDVQTESGTQIKYPPPRSPLASVDQVQFDPKQGFRGLLEILSSLSGQPLRTSGSLESGKRAPEPPSYFKLS